MWWIGAIRGGVKGGREGDQSSGTREAGKSQDD